jgi:hypothetical protein
MPVILEDNHIEINDIIQVFDDISDINLNTKLLERIGTNISINSSGIISSTDTIYTLPISTSSVLGGVKSGGVNTFISSSGVISSTDTIYTLPISTSNVLGGVKSGGSNISINSSGVISSIIPVATSSLLGGVIQGTNTSIDGLGQISSIIPVATSSVLGGVKSGGSNIFINASGVISSTDTIYTLPIGTNTVLGGVRSGTNTSINGLGQISSIIPVATSSVLGGVIQGTNTSIDASGVISSIIPVATSSVSGGIKVGANLSITNGVLAGNTPYVLPVATASISGGIKVGANLSITNGVLAGDTPYVLPVATASISGGIKVGANLSITNGVLAGGTPYVLPSATASIRGGIIVGNNLSISGDVLSSTDTIYTLPSATASIRGGIKVGNNLSISSDVLSSTDTIYTLPSATASIRGGIRVGTNLSISGDVLSGLTPPNLAPYRLITDSYTQAQIDTKDTNNSNVISTRINNTVSSQWTTSGANISYSLGNVGIGTNNPTDKLTVSGTISATAIKASDNIEINKKFLVGAGDVVRQTFYTNNQSGIFPANGMALNFTTLNEGGGQAGSDFLKVVPTEYIYNNITYNILLQTQRSQSGTWWSEFWLRRETLDLRRRRTDGNENNDLMIYFEIPNGHIRIAGQYLSISDSRIKKDIEDIDDKIGLDKILLIQPKTYKYIDETKGTEKVIGFIAQQIKEIIPEAVDFAKGTLPDGKEIEDFNYLNKNYIFTLNVCATQELHRMIIRQQAVIDSLISRIDGWAINNLSENTLIQSLVSRIEALEG